jgi:hypothetical protein
MTRESLQQEHQPQTIRVLTFNILSTDQASWERRRRAARSGLRALRPDILALQETTPGHARDQLTELLGPGTTWWKSRFAPGIWPARPLSAGGRSLTFEKLT